jgi:hypothetical protein
MNNLYPIAFCESGFGPPVTPDYLVVKFDRNSRCRQSQFADQILKRRSIPHFATFAVNLNQQFLIT